MNEDKVLITGAAGFLGSHVCSHLIAKGAKTLAVDDLSGGFLSNIPSEAKWVQGDITDKEFVCSIWRKYGPFDKVYHLAAYAAEGLSHFIRRYNYTNNLIGSVNLLNEAIASGCKCFVFTSSIAVYGSEDPPMNETSKPTPEDPYGIAKYAVELDLKAAHEMWGLNSVIFRPHNIYGEKQNIMDPYRNVVGIFMKCALEKLKFPIFGDGKQTRAFSYVGDVAPIIAESGYRSDCYNETFNIGSDDVNSVKELAKLIASEFKMSTEIEWLEERIEAKHAFADHTKLQKFFPNANKTSLKDGIARMSSWVRETGVWNASYPTEVEIEKSLPDSWRRLLKNQIRQ